MKKIDFDYGTKLIEKESAEEEALYSKYLSKENEVKAVCEALIQEKKIESWDKLVFYITQNETGQYVASHTNWGRIVLLACKVYMLDKKESYIEKISNLEQLMFIFRMFKFLSYRVQTIGDASAKQQLNQLFEYFSLNEQQKNEILLASKLFREGC